MTVNEIDPIAAAARAGVLSKEAVAFFWVLRYYRAHQALPRLATMRVSFERQYGEELTTSTASRARVKAQEQLGLRH